MFKWERGGGGGRLNLNFLLFHDIFKLKDLYFRNDRKEIIISYCINTTKNWLRAIFKENELVTSPLMLHKANILWH